jgi:predicted transcriptional regulator
MDKMNVTVRLEPEKVAILDELARGFDRDRSYLIKQAVDAYLALHRWQVEEIRKATAEADADDFASAEEVEAMFNELLR